MKNKFLYISALSLALLCACTTKEDNEKTIMTPTPTATIAPTETPLSTPTNTPVATPTPTKEQAAHIYLNSLDTIDWMELEGFVDEETSRHNSNFLNYGYLDYDAEGNIYYINKNDGGIYASTCRGENKRLLSELDVAEAMLQLCGEWLYYFNNTTRSVDKIHIETGDTKNVLGYGAYGQFVVSDEKIYIRDDGFCTYDLDGNGKEILPNTKSAEMCFYSRGNGWWICKTTHLSQKGYLVKYDGQKIELINQHGILPLMAGKYLSVVDPDTSQRHIWNLDTKEDINLGVCTEKAIVSDGEMFFYAGTSKIREDDYVTSVYCWDGTKSKEIISAKGVRSIYHMFLAPDMLYYLSNVVIENTLVYQLWYYDLATGETGQIY